MQQKHTEKTLRQIVLELSFFPYFAAAATPTNSPGAENTTKVIYVANLRGKYYRNIYHNVVCKWRERGRMWGFFLFTHILNLKKEKGGGEGGERERNNGQATYRARKWK